MGRAFWSSTGVGVVTHPEILTHIRAGTQLQIHRGSITSLSSTTATLSTGAHLPSDVVILATGYLPHPNITIPAPLAADLGVPSPLSSYPDSLHQKWTDLDALADAEVVRRFPRLADPPVKDRHPPNTAPWRLYNTIVPPGMVESGDRSLVFVGAVSVLDTTLYPTPSNCKKEGRRLTEPGWRKWWLSGLPHGWRGSWRLGCRWRSWSGM